jgi:cell division protein FtsB
MNQLSARLATVFLLLAAVAYALVTLRGSAGGAALAERNRQIAALEKSNQALAKAVERERQRVRKLHSNPAALDSEIRQRLKLMHPSDKDYVTEQAK